MRVCHFATRPSDAEKVNTQIRASSTARSIAAGRGAARHRWRSARSLRRRSSAPRVRAHAPAGAPPRAAARSAAPAPDIRTPRRFQPTRSARPWRALRISGAQCTAHTRPRPPSVAPSGQAPPTVTPMRSIARDGSHELEIQRSRFLCSVARVETPEQAAEFIAAVRKQHWSATHNCSAFRVGPNAEEQRSSDDGEPAGTAGVPMLEVLTRRAITDTVAVVTRYFGGVKLGAGGLVRAYGRSVAEALDAVGTGPRPAHQRGRHRRPPDRGQAGERAARGGHRIADHRVRRTRSASRCSSRPRTRPFDHWLAEHTSGRAAGDSATYPRRTRRESTALQRSTTTAREDRTPRSARATASTAGRPHYDQSLKVWLMVRAPVTVARAG